MSEKTQTVLIVLIVEDHPGVTMKIAGMFARRGHNITSFTGAPSEKKGLSRIIIKADGTKEQIEQIQKQMNKLIEIVKVQVLDDSRSITRELALIKVMVKDDSKYQKLQSLIEVYHGNIIDVDLKQMTIEMVGSSEKIESFLELMRTMNILREASRSGNVALYRGNDSIYIH
jgi:acetolactate synthase I/III small subunit